MNTWTILNIDVDYSPSDPGSRSCYTDHTEYRPEDLKVGEKLKYEDSGGLFSSIRVVEADGNHVVVEYRQQQYCLNEEKTSFKLDEGGRNYTNFWLYVYLTFPNSASSE